MNKINIIFGLGLLAFVVGCETTTRYGQNGERVYLAANSIPDLIIPADLQTTTKIQAVYPLAEGPRRSIEQGPFDAWPPQSISGEPGAVKE